MKLRSEIFVGEQQCVYNDPDDLDLDALHLLALNGEQLIGYARIIQSTLWQIGRVAVADNRRNSGIGTKLMRTAMDHCISHDSSRSIQLSAQVYLSRFYASLGFEIKGHLYLEDGIPHLKMLYQKS